MTHFLIRIRLLLALLRKDVPLGLTGNRERLERRVAVLSEVSQGLCGLLHGGPKLEATRAVAARKESLCQKLAICGQTGPSARGNREIRVHYRMTHFGYRGEPAEQITLAVIALLCLFELRGYAVQELLSP